jgi:hypothetical protein
MSCCGRKRAALAAAMAAGLQGSETAEISYLYQGPAPLLIRGRPSGRIYRFVPGAALAVSAADAAALAGIPGLATADATGDAKNVQGRVFL